MTNNLSNRRTFLQTVAGLSGLALTSKALGEQNLSRKMPPLSFSTLGCPDWTFPAILDFAVKNHYQGIEIRGILRQMDLPQCPEFNSAENIAATRRRVADKGLSIVDLGSSAEMHHPEGPDREKNLDEGKRFIDLAEKLGCPYIRVFPNRLPKEQDREVTIDLITKGLLELGDHAKGGKVTVLMESHGDLTDSALVERIMQQAAHPHTGLVWDVYNMWTVAKEPPAQVYRRLKKYIRHTHLKDGRTVDGKEQYQLLGQGESPIFEAIDLLRAGGYKGYYSFEWEKLWHPEIAAPELALADYPLAMKRHFQ